MTASGIQNHGVKATGPLEMRKRLLSQQVGRQTHRRGEVDIASLASFAYSSEDPHCALEHLIDGHRGPGGTRWASATPDLTECIILEFEPAQHISCVIYEVEESHQTRTQELRLEVSQDRGDTYRQVLAQDYTFSPQGATFQHEEVHLNMQAVTHLRLTIVPNKGGSGKATLTSLQVFSHGFSSG